MEWPPHVTVAVIIEDEGKFLLVEELSFGQLVLNQPAGHLDPEESLLQAAVRETFEETGWEVELHGVVGIALYHSPHNQITYHRTTFYGRATQHFPNHSLDQGIVRALWMSYEEMLEASARMRSPLVIKSVEQFLNGHRYPLELIFN